MFGILPKELCLTNIGIQTRFSKGHFIFLKICQCSTAENFTWFSLTNCTCLDLGYDYIVVGKWILVIFPVGFKIFSEAKFLHAKQFQLYMAVFFSGLHLGISKLNQGQLLVSLIEEFWQSKRLIGIIPLGIQF